MVRLTALRSRARCLLPGLLAVLLAGGCAGLDGREDYDRHRMSTVRAAESEAGVYVFEARAGDDYPLDSEAAERQRMKWLEGWLLMRGWCPAGYELIDRQPIPPGDINLYHMDLRYRLKCAQPAQ